MQPPLQSRYIRATTKETSYLVDLPEWTRTQIEHLRFRRYQSQKETSKEESLLRSACEPVGYHFLREQLRVAPLDASLSMSLIWPRARHAW